MGRQVCKLEPPTAGFGSRDTHGDHSVDSIVKQRQTCLKRGDALSYFYGFGLTEPPDLP